MENVYRACTNLVLNLDVEKFRDHPYFGPYLSYVSSWCYHLPINTIIIGQNPYPQDIYPEFGAGFAYDERKCKSPPKSVEVLADDVYLYSSIDKHSTIECFRDSWKLLQIGVVIINETVFSKLVPVEERTNTRGIREMEYQVLALQTLISESFRAGQTEFTIVGMGIPAKEMTSILRQWCPKDLISMRVLTCANPAAANRSGGDFSSQATTVGKKAVSKVLADIVTRFTKMPSQSENQAKKRRDQAIERLESASKESTAASDNYSKELKSFQDRLAAISGSTPQSSTLENLSEVTGSLVAAVVRHKNALSTHDIAFISLAKSIPPAQQSTQAKNAARESTSPMPEFTRPPRKQPRRVPMSIAPTTPALESVKEDQAEEEPIDTESVAQSLSRSVKKKPRRVSNNYAASVADTEYTVAASSVAEPEESSSPDMSPLESANMKHFANWIKIQVPEDPTYSEILMSAAEEKSTNNALSKTVLGYIKERRSKDDEYDPYDELVNPDSESSTWATENIIPK